MTGTGKTALVTGGSRGIGAAIARRLGAEGYAVGVVYAGNAAAAQEVVAAIVAAGGRAQALQADMADPAAVPALFAAAEAAFGGLDLVVTSAGVMELAPLAASEDAMIARQIAVNLTGTILCLREAARRLRDGGRIVTLSSTVVATHFETYGVYTATKAAVEALTPILARELRGRAITVNSVAPGPTGTELFLAGKSPELIEKLAQANPLGRLGAPEDIADVVAFLAGPQGGWINGQVIRANGGMA